jgi:DNA polymerase I-like protein with 3'-5' exonuclease and polymerase domains
MEWNGLVFDSTLCQQRSEEVNKELTTIQQQLSSVYPDIPINFSSGDQLSAFLYGGIVKEEYKEPIGFFKTGIRKGEPKYKNAVKEHQLPRLVTPLKKTELAKEGFWKTDESTLRQLKGAAAKKYVGPLLRLAELSKLDGTYYKGMININKEMNWPENKIHGQFNQCVAATGRLSSSKPNLQNFAGDCQDIFVSRYGSS